MDTNDKSVEAFEHLNEVIDKWNAEWPDPVEFAKAKKAWDKVFADYRAAHGGQYPSLGEAMLFTLESNPEESS